LTLQSDETKAETSSEKCFGRRREDRRPVWWLSREDRKWLRGGKEVQSPLGPANGADAVNATPLRRHRFISQPSDFPTTDAAST
jgi:hypothetical protein